MVNNASYYPFVDVDGSVYANLAEIEAERSRVTPRTQPLEFVLGKRLPTDEQMKDYDPFATESESEKQSCSKEEAAEEPEPPVYKEAPYEPWPILDEDIPCVEDLAAFGC